MRKMRKMILLIIITVMSSLCSNPTTQKEGSEKDSIETIFELDTSLLSIKPPRSDYKVLNIGLFLSVPINSSPIISENSIVSDINKAVNGVNQIFSQCDVAVFVEKVQVIGLPDHLLDIQGNEVGSWGGHPPAGIVDVDSFNYAQEYRLTEDTRELFGYGKQHVSPNAISVFTVRHIEYYAEQQLTSAGGLSFPPNDYHHTDDYPLRNSVLIVNFAGNSQVPALESEVRTIVHEFAHMLVNTGEHSTAPNNIFNSGTFNVEQCERIQSNITLLFGE